MSRSLIRRCAWWALAPAALVLAIVSWSCASGAARQAVVAGRLVGQDTASGLAGASVQIADLGVTSSTDSRGHFVVTPRARRGCYWLWGRYIGYQPSFTEVAVTDSGVFLTDPIPLRLAIELLYLPTYVPGPCAASLKVDGVVARRPDRRVDPSFPLAVEGATVRLPEIDMTATTDSKGRFTLLIPADPGCYWVQVSGQGYRQLVTTLLNERWRAWMGDTVWLRPDSGAALEPERVFGACGEGGTRWR